jgi:hypothetical protein
MGHALASPSHAVTWLACGNSLAAEIGQPEGDTSAADLGTAKHILLNECLSIDGMRVDRDYSRDWAADAKDWIGKVIRVGGKKIRVDENFAEDVQVVIDRVQKRVKGLAALGHQLTVLLEDPLPISKITGEIDAYGTGDIVILGYPPVIYGQPHGVEIVIIDAKFGYVEVGAINNPQLLMYGLAAYHQWPDRWRRRGQSTEVQKVTLVIEQPRYKSKEWSPSLEQLMRFEFEAFVKASTALMFHKLVSLGGRLYPKVYNVTIDGCRHCKAKAVCPAIAEEVKNMISGDLLDINQVGENFKQLDLVKGWVKAVEGRVKSELLAGNPVPGLKLVRGREGNRKWVDESLARERLAFYMADEWCDTRLKSPTQILKLAKNDPKAIEEVLAFVVREPGKYQVVAEDDPREAVNSNLEEGFEFE